MRSFLSEEEKEAIADMERYTRPLFQRASEAMPGRFRTFKLTVVNLEKLAADLFARGENDPKLRAWIRLHHRKDLR